MSTEKQETRYFKATSVWRTCNHSPSGQRWNGKVWQTDEGGVELLSWVAKNHFPELTAEQAADIIGREAVFGKDEPEKGGGEKCDNVIAGQLKQESTMIGATASKEQSQQAMSSPAAEVTKAASSPQWISVKERLPEANKPFHMLYATGSVARYVVGLNSPQRVLEVCPSWTHWLPATGHYQIPSPPAKKDEKDEADEAFEKWWIGTKIALNAYERDGARIGWNAGVAWERQRKESK